jgi:hypothetical protein
VLNETLLYSLWQGVSVWATMHESDSAINCTYKMPVYSQLTTP